MSENDTRYGWKDFVRWAGDEGVSMDDEDDWLPWWNCWVAAYRSATGEK